MNPVVYIDYGEMVSLCREPDGSRTGWCYSHRGEDVHHLHTSRLEKPFGEEAPCHFHLGDGEVKMEGDDLSFHVLVRRNPSRNAEFDIRLLRMEDGDLREIPFEFIPSREDLFSRSRGILETEVLSSKSVAIIGLGSFGGQISAELAKAGVGEFFLCDFDRVELHNLSRHICYLKDLGRLKTDALEEAILGKNPYAKVHKYPIDINSDRTSLEDIVERSDIVICATDNNHSRFTLSEVLFEKGRKGIFGRAFTRASGGDVFRYSPGGPCYGCLVGMGQVSEEISDEASARRDGRIPAYVSARDASAMVQVGLSSDIEPICNMMVKLALLELSDGSSSGIESLREDLIYDYYIWANRREYNFRQWGALPSPGNLPTILRWYGVKVPRDEGCAICSESVTLDEGDAFLGPISSDVTKNMDLSL